MQKKQFYILTLCKKICFCLWDCSSSSQSFILENGPKLMKVRWWKQPPMWRGDSDYSRIFLNMTLVLKEELLLEVFNWLDRTTLNQKLIVFINSRRKKSQSNLWMSAWRMRWHPWIRLSAWYEKMQATSSKIKLESDILPLMVFIIAIMCNSCRA
jgi:hypothetical protein